MDIDRISEYKIRVTLNREELYRYGLKIDDDTDRESVRAAVSELLFDIGEPVQDPKRERLLLAIHTSDEGGAELFITRLPIYSEQKVERGDALDFFSFPTAAAMRRAAQIVGERFSDLSILGYRASLGGYILSIPHTDAEGISPVDLLSEFGFFERQLAAPLSPEWYTPLDLFVNE